MKKFVMFTPASAGSAIARVAHLETVALRVSGHSVTIVRIEAEEKISTTPLSFASESIDWKDRKSVQKAVLEADAIVYQIGNNFDYHAGGLHWLNCLPGIVCLHDALLSHLIGSWRIKDRAEANAMIERLALSDAIGHLDNFGNHSLEDLLVKVNLVETICRRATAIIIHSQHIKSNVERMFHGVVQSVPLPYSPSLAVSSLRPSAIARQDKVFVTTFGDIIQNKRTESVIRAIAANEKLKEKIVYTLVGNISGQMTHHLTTLAKEKGVKLVVTGRQDDATLATIITHSDIICCLRWPNTETASASAIESFFYGKAVICTNSGFFLEIPPAYAEKIEMKNEVANITQALIRLTKDAQGRRNLGERASAWAKKHFSATNYAAKLVELAETGPILNEAQKTEVAFAGIVEQWSNGKMLPNWNAMLPYTRIFQGPDIARRTT